MFDYEAILSDYPEAIAAIKKALKDKELLIAKDGEYIPRSRLNEEVQARKDLEKKLEEKHQKEIKEFETKFEGFSTVEGQLKARNKELEDKLIAAEELNKDNEFKYRLNSTLLQVFRAKDPKEVVLSLDVPKLKEADNFLVNLQEQIEELKASKAYLFDSKLPPQPGSPTSQVTTPTSEPLSELDWFKLTSDNSTDNK